MSSIQIIILALILFILGGCSKYNNLNQEIIEKLKIKEIDIQEKSLQTTQLNIEELKALYPKIEFYKTKVNTLYLEYPELNLITLKNTEENKIFFLTSMSFRQIEHDFLDQFEDGIFESKEVKTKLIRGFSKLYEELEDESQVSIIDSTNFDKIKFKIYNKENFKETFYLKFENNILTDFNLDFKAIPIH